jgi:uncharacterized protein with von Willebrand factor type A (vWA) domain
MSQRKIQNRRPNQNRNEQSQRDKIGKMKTNDVNKRRRKVYRLGDEILALSPPKNKKHMKIVLALIVGSLSLIVAGTLGIIKALKKD